MNHNMDIEIADIVSMVSIDNSNVKGPLAISFSLIILFAIVVSGPNSVQVSLGKSNSVIVTPTLDSCLEAVKNPDTVPAMFLAACLIFAPAIYKITGDTRFIDVIVNAIEGIIPFR
jgi:hypothetical protein